MFVCLPVYYITQKYCVMKLYGGVRGGKRNKSLNLGGDPGHHADCPIGNLAILLTNYKQIWMNFQDSSAVIQETINEIFGVIWITILTLNRKSW